MGKALSVRGDGKDKKRGKNEKKKVREKEGKNVSYYGKLTN